MLTAKRAVATMAVVWFASATTAANADGNANKGRCVSELKRAGLVSGEVNPGQANFIIGTEGNDSFTWNQLTPGVDVLCGFGGQDGVEFLNEGDIFLGGAGNDGVGDQDGGTFNGGAGNDEVGFLYSGTFNGGAGNERVQNMYGGEFHGGAGNESVEVLTNGGTFNGGAGNDLVTILVGGTFNGGAGNDSVFSLRAGTFNGGAGNDSVARQSGGTFNQD